MKRCTYNMMVDCENPGRKCSRCGWCPEVKKQRLADLRNKAWWENYLLKVRGYIIKKEG